MGLYINPPDQTKEEWLQKHGAILLTVPAQYKSVGSTGTYWVVCLMVNDHFSAAGICFSEAELIGFSDANDHRPKTWFLVEQEDLLEVAPTLLEWEAEWLERGKW